MKKNIACIGNLTKDLLYWVDQFPGIDDVSTVRAKKQCFGGRGAIVAMILSSLNCEVDLITTVPNADLKELEEYFNSHNCSISGLDIDQNATTYNMVLVTIGKKEENCTSLYLPGDCNIKLSNRQSDILNNATILYFSSHDIKVTISILRSIDLKKSKIIVNVIWYMINSNEYFELISNFSNALIGNEIEFDFLKKKIGCTNLKDVFNYFRELEYLVVTRGGEGVHYLSKNGIELNLPALAVTVRTPVGVGDAFSAGLVYGEYHSLSAEKSLSIGLKLAAVSIESDESCPSHEAIVRSIMPI